MTVVVVVVAASKHKGTAIDVNGRPHKGGNGAVVASRVMEIGCRRRRAQGRRRRRHSRCRMRSLGLSSKTTCLGSRGSVFISSSSAIHHGHDCVFCKSKKRCLCFRKDKRNKAAQAGTCSMKFFDDPRWFGDNIYMFEYQSDFEYTYVHEVRF